MNTKDAIRFLLEKGLGVSDGLTTFYQTEDQTSMWVIHTDETIKEAKHYHEEYDNKDFETAYKSFCEHTGMKP